MSSTFFWRRIFTLTVCGGALLATVCARAQLFTTDTTIDAGDTNFEGGDIVALGCTLTVNGPHHFADMLLADGATLTHSFNGRAPTTNGPSFLDLTVDDNVVVDETSAIRADGLNASGPGNGVWSNTLSPYNGPESFTSASGGGHGGMGGTSLGGARSGLAYGSANIIGATEMGSSGGNDNTALGGVGGGLIRLNVRGVVLIDGTVSANGGDGTNSGSGGGSGGSIQMTADSILGNGSIQANGGNGEGIAGGGGGGGRIVISCSENELAGRISAFGGDGASPGGAGTVFIQVTNTPPALLVDNDGLDGTNTFIGAFTNVAELTITNGAVAQAPSSGVPAVLALSSLAIGSNSALVITNNLQVRVTGDMWIAAGGGIYIGAVHFGGDGGGTTTSQGQTSGGGGGNGGYGGVSGGGAAGGAAAGSASFPGGTGGAGGGSVGGIPNLGGLGGGTASLTVGGRLTLNGSVTADGADGPTPGSGGGAGGTITVTAGTMTGAGLISAQGGAGNGPLGGGGGGGQITVIYSTNQFAGSLVAFGGPGFQAGGAGLVTQTTSPTVGRGSVTIDAGNRIGALTPFPPITQANVSVLHGARVSVSEIAPGSLFVGSNSVITTSSNLQQLSTSINITLSPGPLIVEAGGVISLDGKTPYFAGDLGTGRSLTINGVASGGGGGNGGYGGASAFGAQGGNVFGEIAQGGNAGGGGQGANFGPGGNGGGRLEISTQGNVTIDGIVSANGLRGVTQGSGGGAGGTIAIQAGKISGNGIIAANGGAGEIPYGGGGGGGRIVIDSPSNSFNGAITAYGGAGAKDGGAGTIYIEKGPIPSLLVIDNGGSSGTNTPLNGIPTGSNLQISGGAAASFSAPMTVQNLFIGTDSLLIAQGEATPAVTITALKGATIEEGGGIVADGLGNPSGRGLGAGMPFQAFPSSHPSGSGAGHGGFGGSSGSSPGGNVYDSFTAPTMAGSGGGVGVNNGIGGTGGGAVRMIVTGLLTLDGLVSANGNDAANAEAGGGSGGSIYLTADGLAGTGTVEANGGAGEGMYGGGGGGGMISLNSKSNSFAGTTSAHGGAGYVGGGAGTIYVSASTLGNQKIGPLLLVDNGGLQGTNTPTGPILGGQIVVAAYDLQVSGGAIAQPGKGANGLIVNNLLVGPGGVITQANGAANLAVTAQLNATIAAGGAIRADGAGFGGGSGTGAGGWNKAGESGGGGGYGGLGGAGAFGAAGGVTYGASNSPAMWQGSGGGLPGINIPLSQGGGAISLIAHGNLAINGAISANGASARYPGAGGGSGGGIFVSALNISGAGSIAANGGAGDPGLGGGGGGGRIEMESPSNTFAGTLAALGGAGFNPGQAGTIFLLDAIPPQTDLVFSPQISATLDGPGGERNGLRLRWAAADGASYQVFYSTNLIDWTPYGDPVAGSAGEATLSAPCDGESKFFRVVAGQ